MKSFKFLILSQLLLMMSPIADGRINEDISELMKGETTGGHSGSFYDDVLRNGQRELSDLCNVQTCFGFGSRNRWTLGSPCTDELKNETCTIARDRAQHEASQACSTTGNCTCVGTMTEDKCELIVDGNYCRYSAKYTLNGDCKTNDPEQCVEPSCLGVGTSTLESPDECTTSKLEEICAEADEAARLDAAKDCSNTTSTGCGCEGTVLRQSCVDTDVSGLNNPHTKCIYYGVSLFNGECKTPS